MHPIYHHQPSSDSLTDWLPLLLVAALAFLYLSGLVELRRKHKPWNRWLSASFLVGAGLLGAAVVPSLMHWAHHDLRGHMVQHLLLGMFAPVFLVLGRPITLALKTLPVPAARLVTAILRSGVFRFLSYPVSALFLNLGSMYLLYLTPLYNLVLQHPGLHHALHVHFLAAGYLFAWSLVGQDPAPWRPTFRLKLAVLFVSMATHAYLSKMMYAFLYPRPSPHGEDQIREAAKLMYYGGDLAELLLAIVLFAVWYKPTRIFAAPNYVNLKP